MTRLEVEPTTGHDGAEQRFAAMGTRAHVIVEGADPQRLVQAAIDHIDHLERLWSRFRPESEISQLNMAGGGSVVVDPATVELVERAVCGWRLTQGRFDPTMLRQLIELGYDQPFRRLDGTRGRQRVTPPAAPSTSCGNISVDRHRSSVRLPTGLALDPGGIGKGLAADLVSSQLIDQGATRVLVNLGGDIRMRSADPVAKPWAIEIRESTCPAAAPVVVQLIDGGLATSTTQKRRWDSPSGERHHLLDPDTGLPRNDGPQLTSVIAADAWWAEVAATASTDGSCPALVGTAGRRVFSDGTVEQTGSFERYTT